MSKLLFKKMLGLMKIFAKLNQMNNKINLSQFLSSQKPTNSQIQKNKLSKYTRGTVKTGMISLRSLFATGHSY